MHVNAAEPGTENSKNPISQETISSAISQDRLNIIEQIHLEVLSPISTKDYINVSGYHEALFKTFDNQQLALSNMKNTIPEYLEYLAKIGSLEEITDENRKLYSMLSNSTIVQDDLAKK